MEIVLSQAAALTHNPVNIRATIHRPIPTNRMMSHLLLFCGVSCSFLDNDTQESV